MGSSNGGLLMAVCARQWPSLFRAFVARRGVYDMIRFQLIHACPREYGEIEVEADFLNIHKYSPLHNVDSMQERWPAMLLLATEYDDRAVPFHTLKYVAAVHEHMRRGKYLGQPNPVLAKVFFNKGHKCKLDDDGTILAFLQKVLYLKYAA